MTDIHHTFGCVRTNLFNVLLALIVILMAMNSCSQDQASRQMSRERQRRNASTLDSLGYVEESHHDYSRALAFHMQALTAIGDADDTMKANTLEAMGFVCRDMNKYDTSLLFHRRSLELRRSLGREEDEASSLNQIGEILQLMEEYESSNDSLEKALYIARAVHSVEGQCAILLLTGINYAYLGQYQKAIDTSKEVVRLSRHIGRRDIEASAITTIGFSFLNTRKFDSSYAYYSTALEFAREGDIRHLGVIFGHLALVEIERHHHDSALRLIDSSLQIAQAIGDTLDEANALSKLGLVYLSAKQFEKAISSLNQSIVLLERYQLRDRLGVSYARMMRASRESNRLRQAIFFGKLAVNSSQMMRQRVRNMSLEAQREFLKSKEAAYHELAELLVQEGRIPEAQQVIKMLKEDEYFEFIERGSEGRKNAPLGMVLTEDEEQLNTIYQTYKDSIIRLGYQRRELKNKKALTSEERILLSRLDVVHTSINNNLNVFVDRLEEQFRERGDAATKITMFRQTDNDLKEILRTYGKSAVIIQTIVGASTCNIILTTAEVSRPFQIRINQKKLNDLILRFRDSLANDHHDPRAPAHELYKLLVQPLEGDLRAARPATLVWSLDGPLRYVPMAALYDGRRYLVERYSNVLITLASYSKLKDNVRSSWKALGLGVTKAYDPFPPLPGVRDELFGIIRTDSVNAYAAFLPGSIRLNEAFTLDVVRTMAREYPLVHIASHFQLTPGSPGKSFLLLGDGSHLSLRTIRNFGDMFSGVELLTLSACNTAVGSQSARGAEVEDFGVLAQEGGARSVIASLWPVNDNESTPRLMKSFYRLREQKTVKNKAEALRYAQMSLLFGKDSLVSVPRSSLVSRGGAIQKENVSGSFKQDASAPFAHPYFWAPFVMIGNWK